VKIISYNVNGIRAAISKGLPEWLAAQDADIFCVQETKASVDQVDLTPFEELGFTSHWFSAEKKGYSGVATFSKKAPVQITSGIGHDLFDSEGRVLQTDYDDFTLLNCYFPSGTSGDIRQAVKMEFLEYFHQYAINLKKTHANLIILGDYNIAHTEQDIHDPKGNKNSSGFLPEERAWMTSWFDSGFKDSFRSLHPNLIEYSWWTYRAGARAKNKGWRIDYISVSDTLTGRLSKAHHDNGAHHSDHCPVVLTLDS
jgi:exodeoxyribonuclease-3